MSDIREFPNDSERTMYFPNQHYESKVPAKSSINRLSASQAINFFTPSENRLPQRQFTIARLWLTSQIAERRNVNSVDQINIAPGAGNNRFIVPAWLMNEFPSIFHVMH